MISSFLHRLKRSTGPGSVLARAGACAIRSTGPHAGLAVFGVMSFDTDDPNFFTTSIVLHEMGHVLGISASGFTRFGFLENAT